MFFENKYIFFLCALGVFNCFLVSFYFLFFDKQKRSQNLLFGILAFLLSIKLGKTLYMSFSSENNLIYCQIGLSACFLIGVALFYYLKASISNKKGIPILWKQHFLTLILIIVSLGVIKPYSENIEFWNNYVVWFIYFVWGGYLILSIFHIKEVMARAFLGTKEKNTLDVWLIAVFIGNVLIYLAYIVGYYWLYLIEMLTFSFVFYVLTGLFIFQKNRDSIFNNSLKKYGSNKIDSFEAQTLEEKLIRLMEKEELFKNPHLKLKDVASKMSISQHKLSQFLNDNLEKSFSNYINQQRINKAIQLLKENTVFTLEAIGYECGFSSKSVFYSTFKKITGQTPSNFRSQS